MVDVIWWSLLQTRQCCVVLTNSSVSRVCVCFKLSPVSPGLEPSQSPYREREGHRHTRIVSAEGKKPNIVDILDALHGFKYHKWQVRLEPDFHCFHVSVNYTTDCCFLSNFVREKLVTLTK